MANDKNNEGSGFGGVRLPSIDKFMNLGILHNDRKGLIEDVLQVKDNTLALCLLRMIKILKSIGGSGGGCTKSISEIGDDGMKKDIVEGRKILEVMRDTYVWEHLNVGHWKNVGTGWRRGYTFLSLCKCIFMLVLADPLEATVKECDMGLLMGEPILDNILSDIAEDISNRIRNQAGTDHPDDQCEGTEEEEGINKAALPAQHEESRFEISRLDNPSLQKFSDFMKEGNPAVITNGIEHWPARKKWSVAYIRKIAGFRTVPVELGSSYASEEWTQKLMSISEFIDAYMDNHQDIDKRPKLVGYVAQHRLFEQIKDLGNDIKIPDYCFLGDSKDTEINAWFGPGGTVSPTHYDPKHNILVQVFGTKLIRLYPPSESSYLEPHPPHSLLFNTSQIDLENPQVFDKYPQLKKARYCEFLLRPGMMLYMPPKWWHHVKSLSPSFSVSFWFE